MSYPMMTCGHKAQGDHRLPDGGTEPACIICGCYEVDEKPPDLGDRMARCSYYGKIPTGRNHSSNHGCKRGEACLCEEPSTKDLAFFAHRPDKSHDEFYCGCFGWE